MPKTKDAFAFRGFDSSRILQRPYFRQWREKYGVGADLTDEAAILVSEVADLMNVVDNEDETLKAREKHSRKLTDLQNRIKQLQDKIVRHTNKRLEPYRRAVQEKMDKADADVISLQSKVAREQRLVSSYILDASLAIGDLLATVQKLWQASEQELQAAYRRRFGERLRQARERAGLSRKELGDAINISPAGYAYYERGQRDVTPTSLIRIARLLKVSADWLIGLKEPQ